MDKKPKNIIPIDTSNEARTIETLAIVLEKGKTIYSTIAKTMKACASLIPNDSKYNMSDILVKIYELISSGVTLEMIIRRLN